MEQWLKTPVDIYFNLHKNMWSVKDRKTGKVVGHYNYVYAPDGADFVIQKSGQEKVRKTGVKSVHAFVRANRVFVSDKFKATPFGEVLNYDPMNNDTFVETRTGNPVQSTKMRLYMDAKTKKVYRGYGQ